MRRLSGETQRLLARAGLTLVVLVVVGYFVAYMSGETYVGGDDEPGVPGKFHISTALAFAVVLGCAVGGGLTRVWRGPEDTGDPPWAEFLDGFLPWLIGGIVMVFALIFIALGFAALGVGE